MGIGDKEKHFLDPNKTEGPENLSLSTGPTLELCTWSGTSTGTSAWSGMSLPVPWDNNWSWNVSKILVKFWFKRRIWEIGIFPAISVHKDVAVISDFSPATWAWETQERQEYLPSSSQPAATPYSEPWGNSEWGNIAYWPQLGEVHIKGMISVSPKLLASSHTEKSAKFLILR